VFGVVRPWVGAPIRSKVFRTQGARIFTIQ
jgi:hypothetical protein